MTKLSLILADMTPRRMPAYPKNKVLVIGLDAAPPSIVFDQVHQFPTLRFLLKNGTSARFRSTHPPVTVPAWMSMCTGKDPGTLGIYGFRNRLKNSYTGISFVSSTLVREKTIWDILGSLKKRSIVIGVPPGYPARRMHGINIACHLTPPGSTQATYPRSLQNDLQRRFGKLIFDVPFRLHRPQKLLKNIYAMTRQHFDIAQHLMQTQPWDFFMLMTIGPDRIQHAFWKHHDPHHKSYHPKNRFSRVIINYYQYLDKRLAKILKQMDNTTTLLVVSDHGAKAMKGCFCINEWLIQKGYLVLKKQPRTVTDFEDVSIDWRRTTAWGWGGYHARIFLNCKGREKYGIVSKNNKSNLIRKIKSELRQIRGPNAQYWKTACFTPTQLYPRLKGTPPDLVAYIDDLSWRSAGTIGHNKLFLDSNDTGPDDAVHDWDGIFIAYHKGKLLKKLPSLIKNPDFAPTVLRQLHIPIPRDMSGKAYL